MTRPSVALDTSSGPVASRPLASWYAEGASDGLGDRLLMFDNSETPSLELLRFRPELASTPGFESALRERVAELEGFAHPGFPQIRAIQQLDAGGLALVSTSTAGKRLAEVFRAPRVRGGAHPAFAAWLVRDLTAALADLQRHGAGIAHGALTPDRVVLTPDGRLVITEHVLATALDRLRFPVTRLWRDLGIVAISNGGAASRLDCRTDVIQLGWIVLSVLLGRRVAPVEYPSHIEELFDEFVRNSGSRSPSLVPALRRWLERALQLDNQAFESAIDAQDALYELRVHGGPHAIFVGRRHATEQISYSIPPQLAPMPESLLEPEPEPEAPHVEAAVDVEPDLALTESSDSEISHMGVATDFIDEGRGRSVEHQFDHLEPDTFRHAAARRIKLAWSVAAMLAFVAGIEGAVIGRLMGARASIALPSVPITLESLEPGDTVVVDGRDVGVTPLAMTVTPGMRSIRVRSHVVAAAAELAPAPPVAAAPNADTTAAALASARAQRGGVRVVTPIELQVLEGERVLGSTADGPIVTTAGRHELDFINTVVGYRTRQVVEIRAGLIGRMTIAVPNGRVSVNAVPWAQVWINGNAVGDTPLANLPLPVGEHQITFRHPQLGEQTQRVVVKSDALTRVSATFSR